MVIDRRLIMVEPNKFSLGVAYVYSHSSIEDGPKIYGNGLELKAEFLQKSGPHAIAYSIDDQFTWTRYSYDTLGDAFDASGNEGLSNSLGAAINYNYFPADFISVAIGLRFSWDRYTVDEYIAPGGVITQPQAWELNGVGTRVRGAVAFMNKGLEFVGEFGGTWGPQNALCGVFTVVVDPLNLWNYFQ